MSIEDLQKQWDELEVNIVPSVETYPVRRAKFAKVIKEIDLLINKAQWSYWRNWSHWDSERTPLAYCFTCGYPQKPTKTVSAHGQLKKIVCPACDLILFDSRYD